MKDWPDTDNPEQTTPRCSSPPVSTDHSLLGALLRRVEGLHIFRDVLQDEVGSAYLGLLRELAMDSLQVDPSAILSAYTRLFSLLASEVEPRDTPLVGDAWQNHLLDRLLSAENPFSLKAELAPPEAMGASLLEAAKGDLQILRDLFELDGKTLGTLVSGRLWRDSRRPVPWDRLRPLPPTEAAPDLGIPPIKLLLAANPDWPSLLGELALHYASAGVGDFGRFRAFRWVRRNGVGWLEGIRYPDPVRLEELAEYDHERALLLQNTEQFVGGFPANNVLLYGDRGTGKSSTIKALIHRYADRGLRLVEMPKALLEDFPRLVAQLRGRRERFVLFVDDLSFDERETAYKELKAVLEGGLEARPENVVIYATSNRRHLVQERFSDRRDGDDELRRADTHQEKLSLADRFGITLVFCAPDQGRYLRIVESLARARGLQIEVADLHRRALEWAAYQGGLSGRTARQFVDHLLGEEGLARLRSSAAE